jgi:hypothetical protein
MYTNKNRPFIAYRTVDPHEGCHEELCLLGYSAVVQWGSTDISEEHVGCIFKVEEKAEQEISMERTARKGSGLKRTGHCTEQDATRKPVCHLVVSEWLGQQIGDIKENKKQLRGFSPLANYTDRAIAAGQRS